MTCELGQSAQSAAHCGMTLSSRACVRICDFVLEDLTELYLGTHSICFL